PPTGPGGGFPGGAPPSTGGLTPSADGYPALGGGLSVGPGGGSGWYPTMDSPEVALEREIKSLIKAYRTQSGDPTARGQLAKTLNDYVTQQFKIRQDRRDAEIKAIEAELAKVKKLHESRVANQEAIIASRVKELLSTAEGLGWDLPDE